jgi:hypothetical protein
MNLGPAVNANLLTMSFNRFKMMGKLEIKAVRPALRRVLSSTFSPFLEKTRQLIRKEILETTVLPSLLYFGSLEF